MGVLRYHKTGGGQAEVGDNNPFPVALVDGAPGGTIAPLGTLITPKTLTAADDEIVPDPGDGNEAILFSLGIKNTHTADVTVTITDGVTVFAEVPMSTGTFMTVLLWPLSLAWFGAESTAIVATPSVDSVLEVTHGAYYVQAAG